MRGTSEHVGSASGAGPQDCVPRGRDVVRRAIQASMSSGRYRTSRSPIRTVGISPRRLMDHTRVFGTASRSATCPAVINRAGTGEDEARSVCVGGS